MSSLGSVYGIGIGVITYNCCWYLCFPGCASFNGDDDGKSWRLCISWSWGDLDCNYNPTSFHVTQDWSSLKIFFAKIKQEQSEIKEPENNSRLDRVLHHKSPKILKIPKCSIYSCRSAVCAKIYKLKNYPWSTAWKVAHWPIFLSPWESKINCDLPDVAPKSFTISFTKYGMCW